MFTYKPEVSELVHDAAIAVPADVNNNYTKINATLLRAFFIKFINFLS